MKTTDLYFKSDKTTIFYSSIHAIQAGEVKVNDIWMTASEETLLAIIEGKLRYEQLKLVVTPEQIDLLLQEAISKDMSSTIEASLQETIASMQRNVELVTNTFKRAIPQVQDAIEEISKAVASTNSYKRAVDSTTVAISQAKENIPSLEPIKESLAKAKQEFTEITSQLKELFK